jgi:dTDP-4-dehydrorhamnose 3,5-epimerase
VGNVEISGIVRVPCQASGDERGQFRKIYSEDLFESLDIDFKIKQINVSTTELIGAVRGMHYQIPPHNESKVIKCNRGKVFDVVVDLRRSSKTFLKYQTFELSEESSFALLIPAGCAHGFQVLEASSELVYAHSEEYRPEFGRTINPVDPALNIDWPLDISLMSERDSGSEFIGESFDGIQL